MRIIKEPLEKTFTFRGECGYCCGIFETDIVITKSGCWAHDQEIHGLKMVHGNFVCRCPFCSQHVTLDMVEECKHA